MQLRRTATPAITDTAPRRQQHTTGDSSSRAELSASTDSGLCGNLRHLACTCYCSCSVDLHTQNSLLVDGVADAKWVGTWAS